LKRFERQTVRRRRPREVALEWAMRAILRSPLKGRETYIASPSGQIYRNEAGSRALGTAGSGDVLAGASAGLLAQGMEPAHAAIWGVHMHALAGEAVAKDMGEDGVMARDFLERLPAVQKYLRRFTSEKKATGFGLRGGSLATKVFVHEVRFAVETHFATGHFCRMFQIGEIRHRGS
jgi:hypothetical protein